MDLTCPQLSSPLLYFGDRTRQGDIFSLTVEVEFDLSGNILASLFLASLFQCKGQQMRPDHEILYQFQ